MMPAAVVGYVPTPAGINNSYKSAIWTKTDRNIKYRRIRLIDRITREFPLVNASSFAWRRRRRRSDALCRYRCARHQRHAARRVHFDLTYVPLKHLGYKSAVVNFSDIYAMNGTPRQIVVSLGISSRFAVEHIDALYDGLRTACQAYGVDLVGGDTTSSRQGLVISVTCIGDSPSDRIVYRSGARTPTLFA